MTKRMKHKLGGAILCLGIGIILLAYNLSCPQSKEVQEYIFGFVAGMVFVAIYFFVLIGISYKNEKIKYNMETKEKDERYQYLYHMAMAYTFRLSLFLEGVASIVCAFLNKMIYSQILGLLVGAQLIIYLVFYTMIKIKN